MSEYANLLQIIALLFRYISISTAAAFKQNATTVKVLDALRAAPGQAGQSITTIIEEHTAITLPETDEDENTTPRPPHEPLSEGDT